MFRPAAWSSLALRCRAAVAAPVRVATQAATAVTTNTTNPARRLLSSIAAARTSSVPRTFSSCWTTTSLSPSASSSCHNYYSTMSSGSGLLRWPPPLSSSLSPVSPTTSPPTLAGRVLQTAKRTFASKKHKNVLKQTKGFRGRSKNCFSIAIRRLEKSWQYAYRDRKVKKRTWRTLWITRLSAACRQYGWRYSTFVPALTKSNLTLNRKVLSDLAATEPFSFHAVVQLVEHETGTRNGQPINEYLERLQNNLTGWEEDDRKALEAEAEVLEREERRRAREAKAQAA